MSASRPLLVLGPPGAGKTTALEGQATLAWDPEETIDWPRAIHALGRALEPDTAPGQLRYEHQLDWGTVWFDHVLPRVWAAFALQKHVVMGMTNPYTAEQVRRFVSAMPKRVRVLLPAELDHFSRVWGQAPQRPRTWGSRLLGWQHTLATRLLLMGLAADQGLKTVTRLQLPALGSTREKSRANREAEAGGRAFLEVFRGTWAELDAEEQLVALHSASSSRTGTQLTCLRSTRRCGAGFHTCSEGVSLRNDVHGVPLRDWIATDKLQVPHGKKKKALLYLVGSMAPVHQTHLNLMNAAKRQLEAGGWQVLGGYVSARERIGNKDFGDLREVLDPAPHRTAMVQLAVDDSNWLMADDAEPDTLSADAVKKGQHFTQRMVRRLRRCGRLEAKTPVTVFWVNGPDGAVVPEFFDELAKAADRDPLARLRMMIGQTSRVTEDHWSPQALANTCPSIGAFVDRFVMRAGGDRSSTAVRQALLVADRNELARAVGLPLVEAYLLGLMHRRAAAFAASRRP